MIHGGCSRQELAGWVAVAVVAASCATTAPAPKRWSPELPPDLKETCRKTPVDCRLAAERLAASWRTDEEAFGALKAFSAACDAGDTAACDAVDGRFTRPRYVGATPAPRLPPSAVHAQPSGGWTATCRFTSEGKVTACRVDQENPAVEAAMLGWISDGPWAAPTVDGRPFGCEYRLSFSWETR